MNAFDFRKFWFDLSKEKREAFATDFKTSTVYIRSHVATARKMPRRDTMRRLLEVCRKHGKPDLQEMQLVQFFYERQPVKARPRKKRSFKRRPLRQTAAAA